MHKLGIDHTLWATSSQMGALSSQGLKRKAQVDDKEKQVAETKAKAKTKADYFSHYYQ